MICRLGYKMNQLPNIITMLRIAGSFGMLCCDVSSRVFWIIYGFCGISDMTDGWLARKLRCVTRTGTLLDSLADICFVVCCAWQMLPILDFPKWLWMLAGVITVIKVTNQILALVSYGSCLFPHTMANKITGFLLFIAVPMTFWSVIPISITVVFALLAAIHENYFIRMKKTL